MSQFNMTDCWLYISSNSDDPREVRPAQVDELFPLVDGQRTCNLRDYMILPQSWFENDLQRLHTKLREQNDELVKEAEEDHAKYLKLVEAVGKAVNAKDRTGFQQTAIAALREVYDSLGG
jgi:hypothetical protein